jgi:resuscitation-promoting factor RpfB
MPCELQDAIPLEPKVSVLRALPGRGSSSKQNSNSIMIGKMKYLLGLGSLILVSLLACQPQAYSNSVIVDGNQLYVLASQDRTPKALLAQAGAEYKPIDKLILDGFVVPLDKPLPSSGTNTLQVLRAVTLMLNGKTLQTTASELGQALVESGMKVFSADSLDPPAETPITGPLNIHYTPSRLLTVMVDGRQVVIRSSATTIFGALAQAGIPLLGLDYTQPAENLAPPSDGQVRVIRVSESILLTQKSIPFTSEFQASPDVELDHQDILQPGEPGLAVTRTRIRYENGREVSRLTESETIVRPPKDRLVGYGTKVVVHSATVDGVLIQYWRTVQMYATAYSPCNSGVKGQCFSGTSSGLPAGKGVVAVDPSLYSFIVGQRLYIPGYGYATVGDVGGGYIIEKQLGISRRRWIDLGYSDAEIAQSGDQWGKFVTVYFLAPVPQNIPNPLN